VKESIGERPGMGSGGRRWIRAVLVAFALVLPAQAAAYTTTQVDPTAAVNRSVGRLFLNKPNGTVKCTATVVDAPNRSTLFTAGHCLNSAGNGVASSATFAPGYHDGISPFGRWTSAQLLPSPLWDTVSHRHDYGFIVVARDASGRAIEDVVGGLPMGFNLPRAQSYRILGLPAEPAPTYDGEKLWACDTSYAGDYTVGVGSGPPQMMAGCDFGGAASGGPWLTTGNVVASDNSFVPTVPANTMNGPYLDNDAAALFATAGNISTAPVKKKKKCKKKKKGHKRALTAKKKCKKKKHHH
jgi:hypothetical protein